MTEILLAIVTALVGALAGQRGWEAVKTRRRNHNGDHSGNPGNPWSQADIMAALNRIEAALAANGSRLKDIWDELHQRH